MTYHPMGGKTSADYFPDEGWLLFHMLQSGHNHDTPNYDRIAADFARTPTKPCLDGEPGYEDHPAGFKAANGYLDDYDARKAAYWATFSGACGHTYGCLDIWQFLGPGRYRFLAASSGLTDLAGNGLDGEFFGAFPTGDGVPGGGLRARFAVNRGRISGPMPIASAPVATGLDARSVAAPGPAHIKLPMFPCPNRSDGLVTCPVSRTTIAENPWFKAL